MTNNRGQNVIEYILLVAAVLAVFILFFQNGGMFHKTVENSLFDGALKQVKSLNSEIVLPP